MEYSNRTDDGRRVRKVQLRNDLIASVDSASTPMLQAFLNANHKDLFQGNASLPNVTSLLSAIEDYLREKVLRSGSEVEVEAEKAKMDKVFDKQKILSTDPRYVYDKRQSFDTDPTKKLDNEWDDDEEEEEEDSIDDLLADI